MYWLVDDSAGIPTTVIKPYFISFVFVFLAYSNFNIIYSQLKCTISYYIYARKQIQIVRVFLRNRKCVISINRQFAKIKRPEIRSGGRPGANSF